MESRKCFMHRWLADFQERYIMNSIGTELGTVDVLGKVMYSYPIRSPYFIS